MAAMVRQTRPKAAAAHWHADGPDSGPGITVAVTEAAPDARETHICFLMAASGPRQPETRPIAHAGPIRRSP
jgi:hypothetical protein